MDIPLVKTWIDLSVVKRRIHGQTYFRPVTHYTWPRANSCVHGMDRLRPGTDQILHLTNTYNMGDPVFELCVLSSIKIQHVSAASGSGYWLLSYPMGGGNSLSGTEIPYPACYLSTTGLNHSPSLLPQSRERRQEDLTTMFRTDTARPVKLQCLVHEKEFFPLCRHYYPAVILCVYTPEHLPLHSGLAVTINTLTVFHRFAGYRHFIKIMNLPKKLESRSLFALMA